jgi:hypothetical protein
MMRWRSIVLSLILVASLAGPALALSGGIPTITVKHMNGMLAINADRVASVYYSVKGEPASATLRLVYDGSPQAKVIDGADATAAWERIRSTEAVAGRFLWVKHMEGTLGIPLRTIQSLFFTPADGSTAARLRIVHDVETKTIDGADAETIWSSMRGQ